MDGNNRDKQMQDSSLAHEMNADDYAALYQVTEDDRDAVRRFGEYATPSVEGMVSEFYVWLKQQPEFDQFFHDEQTYLRVRGAQPEYWKVLLQAQHDDAYMRERRMVGEVHARIGLPLPVYFAAISTMLELFTTFVSGWDVSDEVRTGTIRSLTKLFQMDTSIVVETYSTMTSETIARQSRSLMAMSTPVTVIWEGVLLLPIVGVVDSQRAQDIMTAILAKVAETSSQIAILDVSGVAVVDTAVANHLIKVTKATRLMGCECTISGVSPAIAQTMVELGIEVGDIRTTATLRDALANAFRHIGVSLVSNS
jgi:rsbT co-antagonist protein RsbR